MGKCSVCRTHLNFSHRDELAKRLDLRRRSQQWDVPGPLPGRLANSATAHPQGPQAIGLVRRSPQPVNALVRRIASSTLGLLPVRVQRGVARGARWTLFPYSSYWRGTHEPLVQQTIENLGNGDILGWNCWDLGAHFGLYSIALALRCGPKGSVAAFEPNPASFTRLERHRRMNGIPWLRTYQAAASDRTETTELLTYGQTDTTSAHLFYEGETRNSECTPIAIRSLRLDELAESGELRAPQFVKIDVEGHGHKALEGMKGTLAKSRPTLIVAFHSNLEVDGVLEILRALDYRWTPIAADPTPPKSMVGGDYLFTPLARA
jgi:FkbM family methyltransferase